MGGADRMGHEGRSTRRQRDALAAALREAREYTLRLYAHLAPGERVVPRLAIVNPPAWELAHVGWFQEFWCRRWRRDDPAGAATPSRLAHADAWLDSRHVPHDVRWDLPLRSWEAIHDYLAVTLADTLERMAAMRDDELHLVELAVAHEDMHGEAMLMTLQTLALPAPPGLAPRRAGRAGDNRGGDDVVVDGGPFTMGAPVDAARRYVFDNERPAQRVQLRPFAIARLPVTAAAFADFVDDGGYRTPRWWDDDGRAWLAGAGREHPSSWRRSERTGTWEARRFDGWTPLEPQAPMVHVNRHEARAWCRWAGRRLPIEAEWERAAQVGAVPLQGAVWEWTASPFTPYPGFAPGVYAEYSAPWFGDHAVLRGGSWATHARLAAPSFRNFYHPERDDPFAGFRTCPC